MALTDERIESDWKLAVETSTPIAGRTHYKFARSIESAATAPLLERIAHLEATASANYGCGQADAHSMLSERIAELEQQLSEACKDAERWAHACKGNNKQINVCSWDGDAYEFVGYAMKKEAIDAIADEEIAAMKGQQ